MYHECLFSLYLCFSEVLISFLLRILFLLSGCRKGSCCHEFCWICLQPWNGHRGCNVLVEPTGLDANSRKAVLERYVFYVSRVTSHEHSLSLERKVGQSVGNPSFCLKFSLVRPNESSKNFNSVNQSINQSVSQSINQSSTKQSINQPVNGEFQVSQ